YHVDCGTRMARDAMWLEFRRAVTSIRANGLSRSYKALPHLTRAARDSCLDAQIGFWTHSGQPEHAVGRELRHRFSRRGESEPAASATARPTSARVGCHPAIALRGSTTSREELPRGFDSSKTPDEQGRTSRRIPVSP